MTELVKVRGLNRQRGIRVGGGSLTSAATRVVDLDDGASRRDLAHHSAIGQYVVVGDADAAVKTGVVVSNGTTTTYSVSAGTVVAQANADQNRPEATLTVNAVSNQAITAPDGSNPRIDLVHVDLTSGAIGYTAGTAGATPAKPATPANKLLLATLTVAAGATTPAGVVVADKALRM